MLKRHAALALLAAMALAAAGCGSDDSSSGNEGHGASHGSSEASKGLAVDRAFAQAMVPHHESAVEMAQIAQERGESRFVRRLAENIISTQLAEIDILESADKRLAGEGAEVGSLGVPDHMMGMDGDTASLKTAEPFDKAFMEMMIEHHEGAVEMAKVEQAKGADAELKNLAQAIIRAQESEIAEMREQLGAG